MRYSLSTNDRFMCENRSKLDALRMNSIHWEKAMDDKLSGLENNKMFQGMDKIDDDKT